MRFAWTLGALGLILLGSWWGLNSWLEIRALAIWRDGGFKSKAEGWEIVTASWPLLVSFGLILAVVFTVIFGTLLEVTKEADFKAEIKDLKANTEKAEKNAQNARDELLNAQSKANSIAERNYARLIEEIEKREHQANLKIQSAEKLKQEANKKISELQTLTEKANHQKTRAMAYNERKKKKQAELKQKVANGNATYEDVRKALD